MIRFVLFLVVSPLMTYSMFLDNNPCIIDMWDKSTLAEELTYNDSVPALCKNGTFRWDYPRGTVNLRFQNPHGHSLSVCVSRVMLLTVQDNKGHDLSRGNQNCTAVSPGDIMLRVDAYEQLVYVGWFDYEKK